MKRAELDRMSIDDLWLLHVEVSQLLQQKIQQEKLRLEERLKVENSSVRASAVPAGIPKIPQSRSAVRDLVRSWQAAALACRAVEIGKADRGFQYPGSEQDANQRSACGVQTPSVISTRASATVRYTELSPDGLKTSGAEPPRPMWPKHRLKIQPLPRW